MFNKILVANRSEIAVRITRSAQALGVKTVAVYSDADRHAPHVAGADEAIHIGASAATESYLSIEKIIAAAVSSGAEAIHPGYGFLSENPDFAAACDSAGIVFIGPSAATIQLMGSKRDAKALMAEHGVPVVPGFFGEVSDADLAQEAQNIGFPVLIKASAGGGGRGMRLVRGAAEFEGALQSARREAKSAFGDDTVLLEKYIEHPRHIEVQIFGDRHGNVVHLFERDCTVQRRYQKVIEEAPAAALNDDQRETIHAAAITAGKAAAYVGAGTVEFVVDKSGQVFFIEMNTRLQVEHPVTEMITGQDLVAWQLNVASGRRLPSQESIKPQGHAIELRLCAEDAPQDFAPSTGTITHLRLPEKIARIDHGIEAGATISPFYDSMIAKIICYDNDRTRAIERCIAALGGTEIGGITTNRDFLRSVLRHPDFQADDIDTHFIDQQQVNLLQPTTAPTSAALLLTALFISHAKTEPWRDASPWGQANRYRINLNYRETFKFVHDETAFDVALSHTNDGIVCELEGNTQICTSLEVSGEQVVASIDGHRLNAAIVRDNRTVEVFCASEHYKLTYSDPLDGKAVDDAATGNLNSPMPGTVLEVYVEVDEAVVAGAPLMLIEAMKIEHTISAPFDGTVTEIRFSAGDQIDAEGVPLAVMAPAD